MRTAFLLQGVAFALLAGVLFVVSAAAADDTRRLSSAEIKRLYREGGYR